MLNAFRYIAVPVAICFASLYSISSRAQAEGPEKFESAKLRAYTKAFAKRFALPDPSIEIESDARLQAIEFSIEKARGKTGFHWCVLKTYLDSDLPIDYPLNGNSGSRNLVELPEHFVFDNNATNQRWLSLSVEDRLHFSRQDRYGRRAAIASWDPDWPKKGYWRGLLYDAFYRELFPGVSYIKFSAPCGAYVAGGETGSVQLWIERVGGKDYGRILKPDPEDFLKLNVPSAFYQAVLRWAKPANEYDRAQIEQRGKR